MSRNSLGATPKRRSNALLRRIGVRLTRELIKSAHETNHIAFRVGKARKCDAAWYVGCRHSDASPQFDGTFEDRGRVVDLDIEREQRLLTRTLSYSTGQLNR